MELKVNGEGKIHMNAGAFPKQQVQVPRPHAAFTKPIFMGISDLPLDGPTVGYWMPARFQVMFFPEGANVKDDTRMARMTSAESQNCYIV